MIALLGLSLDDLLCWVIVLPTVLILVFRAFVNSDDRPTLLAKWGFTALMVLSMCWISTWQMVSKPLILVIPASLIGTTWLSNWLDMLFRPFTNALTGGTEEAEARPYYYLADGKRRQSLYQEAADEVRKQLELFPGDAEGLLKLATIQAEDLHDLPAAVATLEELLQQPDLPPGRTAATLQTLADWQLNLGRNTAAARAAFERIVQLFPDSSFSHNAEQRLAHLDGVNQTREFHEKAVFRVPSRERGLGLGNIVEQTAPSQIDPDTLAAEYVSQLERYPNDTDTREKLARLYAEEFDRLDLALSQIEQMVALPNETPQHIAHWLDLLATFHVRYGHDINSAENALRRIIERFPKSAPATRAQARLSTLPGELKAATNTAAAKPIGAYEKDLGLKSGSVSKL